MHVPKFLHQKMQHQKLSKNHSKTNFPLVFCFFGPPPLAPNRPLPRAIFDGICDVLCTSSTPQKRAVFCLGGGPPLRFGRLQKPKMVQKDAQKRCKYQCFCFLWLVAMESVIFEFVGIYGVSCMCFHKTKIQHFGHVVLPKCRK